MMRVEDGWEVLIRQVAVAGRVLDGETRRPISDALITIRAGKIVLGQKRSAADGHYHFLDLANGSYVVSASLPGVGSRYASAEQPFTVTRDARKNLKIAIVDLLLRPSTVRGRIANADGEPVKLAEIRVKGSGERTFSEADGRYRLSGIETSRRKRKITASAPGYEAATLEASLEEPGKDVRLDFTLERMGTRS